LEQQGISGSEAWQSFLNGVVAEVESFDRRALVWQDAMTSGLQVPGGATVQTWRCTRGGGARAEKGLALEAAKQGYSVLQSTCWYLDDHFSWQDFYGFDTDDREAAQALAEAEASHPHEMRQQLKNILGGEVALYSERVDFTNFDCRLWPRAATVAERLWCREDLSKSSLTAKESDEAMHEVRARLMVHTHRLQRLFGVRLRPLVPRSDEFGEKATIAPPARGELLADEGAFISVEKACPLIKTQATQRLPSNPVWAPVLEEAFGLWNDDNLTKPVLPPEVRPET